ncbi:GIY-YIG nuclease family protein [Luteimicrobium sp. NPDC057192]|uniref:GIY-YIG nuclease family protein n=1 Tax=Luteimicrobium sp. NPDC057192 TaxID=3346042 RepID=UPI003633D233
MSRNRCAWFGCQRTPDPRLDIPMCMAHAVIAAQSLSRYETAQDDRTQARVTADAEALATATAKVEAGVRLDPDESVPGWVYYLRIDDTVKIGYARDVRRRMSDYPPTAVLLAVEPGTRNTEAARHEHFRAHLAHGREWFTPNSELDEWIATLCAEYGDPARHAYQYTQPNRQVVAGKRARRRGRAVV